MPTRASVRIEDVSAEISRFEPNVADDTAANQFTAIGNIITPAYNDALIVGLPQRYTVSQSQQSGIAGTIGGNAHRELKWLVVYEDTQQFLDPPTNALPNPYFGRRFALELPTANPAILASGTDVLPLTATQAANFVTAFNANARSPVGGSVAVREIRLVGRAI